MRGRLLDLLFRVRSLLPDALVPTWAALRYRVVRLSAKRRSAAEEQMRFVVGDVPRAELDRHVEDYLRRSVFRGETRYNAELVRHARIEGLAVVEALRDASQGFVIDFVHHGDYETICASMGSAGVPSYAYATSMLWEPGAPHWLRMQKKVIEDSPGVTLVDAARGSAYARELLKEGSAVAIATDQPGHTPVEFLGHRMHLSSGAIRVAFDTASPVVVVTSSPDPDRPHGVAMLTVHEPLLPRDFESVEAMLDVVLRMHEQAFRAWPGAAETPMRMLDMALVKAPSEYQVPVAEAPGD